MSVLPYRSPRGAGRRRHLRTVHRRAACRASPVSSPQSLARDRAPKALRLRADFNARTSAPSLNRVCYTLVSWKPCGSVLCYEVGKRERGVVRQRGWSNSVANSVARSQRTH